MFTDLDVDMKPFLTATTLVTLLMVGCIILMTVIVMIMAR